MPVSVPDSQVNVDNCDKEPINIPGAIQPHGVLIGFDEPALRVVQVSDNTRDILGVPPADLFGRPLSEILDPASASAIRASLTAPSFKRLNPIAIEVNGRPFDGILHRSGALLIVELEPAHQAVPGSFRDYGADIHQSMLQLQGASSLGELLQDAADGIRRITGYDRVMVYRFDEEDHGQVVAEAREPALEPFLGLHYPASDIPAQARRLYLLNPLRIIADVAYRPSGLLVAPGVDVRAPLDLTYSTLRSVSPIHVEYLRNMGVSASMSVSIVHEGRLWGLIACHHYAPKFVAYSTRMTCELLGQMLSTMIQSWRVRDEAGLRESIGARKLRLLERLADTEYLAAGLTKDTEDLLGLMGAAAAAILEDGRFTPVGPCPPEQLVRGFATWLSRESHAVFASHRIAVDWPGAPPLGADVTGVVALSLPHAVENIVMWFRPAAERTVSWAGSPEKVYTEGPNGPRLTPRGSFALWKEHVKNQSERWSPIGLDAGTELRARLIDVVLKKTVEVERSRDMLLGMVSHDLRNPLGAITLAARLLGSKAAEESVVTRTSARIAASSDRMRRMIEQLLDYTRSKSGSITLSPAEFDLVTLCRHLAEEIEEAHPGFTVKLDLPASCPFVGDVDRLAQVISNLLGNARHHGDPAAPASLALRCGNQVEIEVRNQGSVIPPERLATIFEPFKVERTDMRARKHSGLGLGLFIVKRIVDLHGGTIHVTSSAEEGVVCLVRLPRPTSASDHTRGAER